MRRWNGWGDESTSMDLPQSAGCIFISSCWQRATTRRYFFSTGYQSSVPKSRLPEHPLVSLDAEERVRHAKGQSLPDYLAMRSGELRMFS